MALQACQLGMSALMALNLLGCEPGTQETTSSKPVSTSGPETIASTSKTVTSTPQTLPSSTATTSSFSPSSSPSPDAGYCCWWPEGLDPSDCDVACQSPDHDATYDSCSGSGTWCGPSPSTTAPGSTTSTTTSLCGDLELGAEMMKSMSCHGPELGQQPAESPQQCQELCSEQDGCLAWSFDSCQQVCSLQGFCDYLVRAPSHHISGVPLAKPQNLQCTRPQQHLDCEGNDLDVVPGLDFDGCCERCASTAGCLVFTVTNGTCHLKSRCPKKTYTMLSISGWMQRPGREVCEDCQAISKGSFEVQGYICGDGFPATTVFFPEGPGPFGVVVHRPGTGGFELDRMDDWLETVASLGLVVLTPFTGRGECRGPDGTGHAYQDLLTLLEAAYKGGAALHPVLGKVDWQRVGVMGHSMGAKAALMAAAKSRSSSHFPVHKHVRIVAVVASHDSADAERVPSDVATLFATGSRDWPHDVMAQYAACPSASKVLANLDQGHHMEPVPDFKIGWGNGCARQNFWTAQFLSCHVGRQQEHCDRVYGNEPNSMRHVNEYTNFSAVGRPEMLSGATFV